MNVRTIRVPPSCFFVFCFDSRAVNVPNSCTLSLELTCYRCHTEASRSIWGMFSLLGKPSQLLLSSFINSTSIQWWFFRWSAIATPGFWGNVPICHTSLFTPLSAIGPLSPLSLRSLQRFFLHGAAQGTLQQTELFAKWNAFHRDTENAARTRTRAFLTWIAQWSRKGFEGKTSKQKQNENTQALEHREEVGRENTNDSGRLTRAVEYLGMKEGGSWILFSLLNKAGFRWWSEQSWKRVLEVLEWFQQLPARAVRLVCEEGRWWAVCFGMEKRSLKPQRI